MGEGIDIVVFPFHDLRKCEQQGLRRRDTSVILGLADHPAVSKVLVIDRPLALTHLALERLRGRAPTVRGGRVAHRETFSQLTQVSEKLFVLDWAVLDVARSLLLRRAWWPHILEQEVTVRRARKAADLLGIRDPVLWLFTPISSPLIGRLGEWLVVFDAIDNWLEHPEMGPYRKAAARGYATIRDRADVVFSVSASLAETLSTPERQAHWIPNGVDLSLFTIDGPVAPEVAALPSPRIGYAGVVERRVDLDLVAGAASAMPEASFVFVGPYDSSLLGGVQRLPNVHFLGARRFEEIPAYVRGMDVCMMPHKVDEFTRSMNPLKLYEYLACGKPVVSTPVAGVELFDGLVDVATTPREFVECIRSRVDESPDSVSFRRRAAEAHSWEGKISEMLDRVFANQRTKQGV